MPSVHRLVCGAVIATLSTCHFRRVSQDGHDQVGIRRRLGSTAGTTGHSDRHERACLDLRPITVEQVIAAQWW